MSSLCIPAFRSRDITPGGGSFLTKVAVEQGLRPFQSALRNAGFIVVELRDAEELPSVNPHAVVVSGAGTSLPDMSLVGDTPIINAVGRTPEEVVNEVRRSLGPRE
jgi:hypothetical protein